VAKQRAKIAADAEVEVVVYPPRKSFYELVSDQFGGGREQMAVGAWMTTNLTPGELAAVRLLRGPFAIFRRGEPLALMPFTFMR
jgi:hypothetical protein